MIIPMPVGVTGSRVFHTPSSTAPRLRAQRAAGAAEKLSMIELPSDNNAEPSQRPSGSA